MIILKSIVVIKMYFRLNSECYFIRGRKCGAIFDLIEKRMYALNPQETELITSCERNNPIHGDEELLKELKVHLLGNFYSNKTYVQKLRLGTASKTEGDPPELNGVFLEINNSCNRACSFCGYYGIKRTSGCLGCNKWNETSEPLALDRWLKLIDELKDLDCKNIFITGGDLTLAWDKTMEVLDHANGKFNEIYVVLHEKSLSESIIDDLRNKSKIIIQTEDIHSLPFEGSTLLLVVKPEDRENISSIGNKNIMMDFVFENSSCLPNSLPIISKKKLNSPDMYRFLHDIKHHPCLGNMLTICHDGNVIPCPMMRSHSFGNIRDRELYTIFERGMDEINKFWDLTLDYVEGCKECEFRYACNDCRASEESLTGRLDGKKMCSYDPKRGVWL